MSKKMVGIIGGSGLYEMEGLQDVEQLAVETPFGSPSDSLVRGRVDAVEVLFLPRHGRGHRIAPSFVNFRANIFAMKKLGVEWIIGVSAVGSMKETIHPGHIVIPDQFIDRTSRRPNTFFEDGIVVHVSMADPVCPELSELLYQTATELGATVHKGGTYLCIEGPQFSTRAESKLYRSWGVDVIGMTNIPEAKLAREAEICYATIAFAADYDCWNEKASDVSVSDVLRILAQSTKTAQEIIRRVLPRIPTARDCPCAKALASAFITEKAVIPEGTRKTLEPIVGKYL